MPSWKDEDSELPPAGGLEDVHAEEHAWVAFRLAGWGILFLAQLLILVNTLRPAVFNDEDLWWFIPVLIMTGIIVVAIGFEKFVTVTHKYRTLAAREKRTQKD